MEMSESVPALGRDTIVGAPASRDLALLSLDQTFAFQRVEQGIQRTFTESKDALRALERLAAQAVAVQLTILQRVENDQGRESFLQLVKRRAHTSDTDVSWSVPLEIASAKGAGPLAGVGNCTENGINRVRSPWRSHLANSLRIRPHAPVVASSQSPRCRTGCIWERQLLAFGYQLSAF